MIRQVAREDIKTCVEVIRKSFETVSKEFNLTQENCPGHTSFIKVEKLNKQYDEGRLMFVYLHNNIIAGYFSLRGDGDKSYEMDNLAVLPEYRHKSFGKEMIAFAINKVMELGGNTMTIGIIEENVKLKNWYSDLGFIHIGTKKYEHLPFTVGFMKIMCS